MAINTLRNGEVARVISENSDGLVRVSPKNTPFLGDSLRLYDGYAEIKDSPITLNNPAFGNKNFDRIRTSTVINGVRYVLIPQSNWQLYRVSDTLSSVGTTGCAVPNSIWLTEETSGYAYIVGANSGATQLRVYQTDGNAISEITLSAPIAYSTNLDVATLPSGELFIARTGTEYYIVSQNGTVSSGKMLDSALDQVFLEKVGNAIAFVGVTAGSLISGVTVDGVNWKSWDSWTVGDRDGDDGDVNATYQIQSGSRIEVVDTAIFGGGFSVLACGDTTHTTNYLARFTNGGYSITNPTFDGIVSDRADISALTLKDRNKCTILAHGYDERELYVTVLDNESTQKELCTYKGILSQSKTLSTYSSTNTIAVPTISAPERLNGVKETFYMNADLDSKFISVFNGLGHCYSNSFIIIKDEDNESETGGGLPAHDLESHTDVVYDQDTLSEGNALLRNPDGNWQNSNVIEGQIEAEENPAEPVGIYVPSQITSIAEVEYITWADFLTHLPSFTETDPIFTASVASGISASDITNWDSAYTYSQVGHLPLTGGTLTGDLSMGGATSNDSTRLRFNSNTATNVASIHTEFSTLYYTSNSHNWRRADRSNLMSLNATSLTVVSGLRPVGGIDVSTFAQPTTPTFEGYLAYDNSGAVYKATGGVQFVADDAVGLGALDTTNTPTSGQVLQYDGADIVWATVSGGSSDGVVTGATFISGLLSLQRSLGLPDVSVNLDGRYLLSTHPASGVTTAGIAEWNAAYANIISGLTFDSSTGNLTATRPQGGNFVTNFDGRYLDDGKEVTGIAFSGSSTKTLTMTFADASTLTASFTDSGGGGGVADGVVNGATFNTSNGELSLTRTESLPDVVVDLDGRYLTSSSFYVSADQVSGNAQVFNGEFLRIFGGDSITTVRTASGSGVDVTVSLDDLGVTEAKIASNAVTTAKVNDLAITTAKVNDLAVTNAKLADLSVTTGKINDLAVTDGKIASNAVTTSKVNDLAITNAKIADDTISEPKLDIHNLPTDGYVLRHTAANGMEWVEPIKESRDTNPASSPFLFTHSGFTQNTTTSNTARAGNLAKASGVFTVASAGSGNISANINFPYGNAAIGLVKVNIVQTDSGGALKQEFLTVATLSSSATSASNLSIYKDLAASPLGATQLAVGDKIFWSYEFIIN